MFYSDQQQQMPAKVSCFPPLIVNAELMAASDREMIVFYQACVAYF